MSNTRQRLGKGLEALLPKSVMMSGKTIATLSVALIDPNPFQPRLAFDQVALQQLADSIKHHGLAQPVVVRRNGDRYELIAGERRFRATKLAGLETIPVIIRTMTDQESLQLALIENLQREDLNPIEEAKGYVRLAQEFGLTHQALSDVFGKSRSAVTNTLRLLNLPEEIQQALIEVVITEGHARTLLALESPEKMMAAFAAIRDQQMNVRDVERHIAGLKPKSTAKRKKIAPSAAIQEWEKSLAAQYSTKVQIKGRPSRGKIEIAYTSAAQLDKLMQLLTS